MELYNKSYRIKELLDRIRGKGKVKVLFVCLGNICRSPAAETMMNEVISEHHDQARWQTDSCGIGRWHVGQLADPRMRAHARRRGLEITHVCRQVCTDDFFNFDIIVGMDSQNLYDLRELAPDVDSQKKIVGMAEFLSDSDRFDHIPDPYYDGAQGFETVLDLLAESTLNLYDTVSAVL